MTQVTDLHGELTAATYDGFSRVCTRWEARGPGEASAPASAVSSCRSESFLPSDASATPYSYFTTGGISPVGADLRARRPTGHSYQTCLGRIRSLDPECAEQADPSAGDPAAWIIEQARASTTERAPSSGSTRPVFFSGAMGAGAPVTPTQPRFRISATTPSGAPSRPSASTGPCRCATRTTLLSVDHWDAADLEVGGAHEGRAPAAGIHDGHGRTSPAIVERIHVGNTIEGGARPRRRTSLPASRWGSSSGCATGPRRLRSCAGPSTTRWAEWCSTWSPTPPGGLSPTLGSFVDSVYTPPTSAQGVALRLRRRRQSRRDERRTRMR